MSRHDMDDLLVEGVRERSETAFSDVYRLMASELLSFAQGMLRDRGAAEDAVQQAFLELAVAAPTIRGGARSLRCWLFRAVRFSCLDELRRRRRRPEDPAERIPETAIHDDIDLPDPDLREALMALTDQQRAIVVLRHVIGFPARDIARILDSNRAAVYAASARAERRLRRLLAESDPANAASAPITEGKHP